MGSPGNVMVNQRDITALQLGNSNKREMWTNWIVKIAICLVVS